VSGCAFPFKDDFGLNNFFSIKFIQLEKLFQIKNTNFEENKISLQYQI
jgi:hypothetical protein